ncbi:hypothetical protein C8F01DRAFT_666704 [Mycena amicta]|nr:hypothetical protein C8F01DRAFT_666704 [Mycena amicta]
MPNLSTLLHELRILLPTTNEEVVRRLLVFVDAIDGANSGEIQDNAEGIIDVVVRFLPPPDIAIVRESSPEDYAQTHCSGGALTALLSAIRRCNLDEILPSLISCWPATISAALLYGRAIVRTTPELMLLGPDHIGTSGCAFTTLISFFHIYAKIDDLRSLILQTPRLIELIVAIWQHEAYDLGAGQHLFTQLRRLFLYDCLPSSASLLPLYVLSSEGPLRDTLLMGTATRREEIANTALRHMRKSISVLSLSGPDEEVLKDVCVDLENLTFLHGLTSLQQPFLVDRHSLVVVTEVLLQSTAHQLDMNTAGIMQRVVGCVCRFLNVFLVAGGISGLVDALERGLLVGLARAHPWLELEDSRALVEFTSLFTTHLPKYLIYLSVLDRIRASFDLLGPVLSRLKNLPRCSSIWSSFLDFAVARMELTEPGELRGMEKCHFPNCFRPATFRCANCMKAAYCSPQCQKTAWHSQQERHWANCFSDGMRAVPNPEDIRFALRVFRQHLLYPAVQSQICDTWSHQGSQSLPLYAGIDYTVHPPAVTFAAPRLKNSELEKRTSTLMLRLWMRSLYFDDNKRRSSI